MMRCNYLREISNGIKLTKFLKLRQFFVPDLINL